jgi:hypothetical protein
VQDLFWILTPQTELLCESHGLSLAEAFQTLLGSSQTNVVSRVINKVKEMDWNPFLTTKAE